MSILEGQITLKSQELVTYFVLDLSYALLKMQILKVVDQNTSLFHGFLNLQLPEFCTKLLS